MCVYEPILGILVLFLWENRLHFWKEDLNAKRFMMEFVRVYRAKEWKMIFRRKPKTKVIGKRSKLK